MIRGTTAQFQFKLPYRKEDVEVSEVRFWQPGNNNGLNDEFPLPITKGYVQRLSEDGSVTTSYPWNWIDDYTLSVRLGQQETFTFSDRYKAYVQLRARTKDGLVFASTPEKITVYPLYTDVPLGDDIIPSPDDEDWVIFDGEIVE